MDTKELLFLIKARLNAKLDDLIEDADENTNFDDVFEDLKINLAESSVLVDDLAQ